MNRGSRCNATGFHSLFCKICIFYRLLHQHMEEGRTHTDMTQCETICWQLLFKMDEVQTTPATSLFPEVPLQSFEAQSKTKTIL